MKIALNWNKLIPKIIALTLIIIAIAVVVMAFEIPVQWPKARAPRITY